MGAPSGAPAELTAMKVSPLAGKPAPPAMLVNVPRLITAYYADFPDVSVPQQRVAFGTSGHRGSSLERSFNEWHVVAITEAICRYRKQTGIDGPLFLGMDTHALSEPAVASALEVLAANGVEVMIAGKGEYTPTPVISHAILAYNRGRTSGFADGIVITPSHNPPNGGPADLGVTGLIEARANEFLNNGLQGVKRIPYEKALRARPIWESFVVAGNTVQIANPAFIEELKRWIRFSRSEALAQCDGLFAGSSGSPAMPRWLGSMMFGLFVTSRGENGRYAAQMRGSAGVAVFAADRADTSGWVAAGRACELFSATSRCPRYTHYVRQPARRSCIPACPVRHCHRSGRTASRSGCSLRSRSALAEVFAAAAGCGSGSVSVSARNPASINMTLIFIVPILIALGAVGAIAYGRSRWNEKTTILHAKMQAARLPRVIEEMGAAVIAAPGYRSQRKCSVSRSSWASGAWEGFLVFCWAPSQTKSYTWSMFPLRS